MRRAFAALSRSPYAAFLAALLIYAALLLIGPRAPSEIQRDFCVTNFEITETPFGLSLNCDSLLYLEAAEEPEILLASNSILQTRPGIIFADILLKQPFRPFNDAPEWIGLQSLNNWIDPARINAAVQSGFPEYAAFILINLLLLHSTFLVLRYQPSGQQEGMHDLDLGAATTVVALSMTLLTNDVSKVFIWSPHTQIFNIAVPVMAVWLGLWTYRGGLLKGRLTIAAWAFTAWSILSYGAGVIILGAMGVAALARLVDRQPGPVEYLLRYIGFSIAAILPLIAWLVFVRAETGSIYSAEVERYRQFIWIGETFLAGGIISVLEIWFQNFFQLVQLGISQAWPAAILIFIASFTAGSARPLRASLMRQRIPLLMCVITSVLAGALYATIGFIQPRLAFSLAAPLVLASAFFVIEVRHQLAEPRRTALTTATACFTIGLILWTVIKDGPYS